MLDKDLDTKKFDISVMDESELRAFKFFLISEKERHLEDILDIEKLLSKVEIRIQIEQRFHE